jgi:HlyD family secretion protein
MGAQIFRKVSLDRLSSPEQLDILMKITTPQGWLALIALMILCIISVIWGLFGRIPTKVLGQGMLIKSSGVSDVVSLRAGQINTIYANVGDIVEKGAVVGRMTQPKLIEDIKKLKVELQETQAEFERIKRYGSKDTIAQSKYMANERRNIKNAIDDMNKRLLWLNEKLVNQKKLFVDGLIVKQEYLQTDQEIQKINQEIKNKKNQLNQVDIQALKLENQKERELNEQQQKINQHKRSLASYQNEYETSSRIISPYYGRVLEITAAVGELIDRGHQILILEQVGKDVKPLEAVFYIPAMDGKKVYPGMTAQISPFNVKREEYGFMLGMVTNVSEFPSTPQGMKKVLNNESLIKVLSQGAAPIEIYADLVPDPRTVSQYKWSSPKGPQTEIHSGTMCYVSITVREQAPITLVIPLLKRYLLGVGDAVS